MVISGREVVADTGNTPNCAHNLEGAYKAGAFSVNIFFLRETTVATRLVTVFSFYFYCLYEVEEVAHNVKIWATFATQL